MRIKVTRTGKSIDKVIMEATKELPRKIKTNLNKLGKETALKMRSVIKSNIKRPGSTGNLEKSVTVEYSKNGWGVGNKNRMDSQAKYWRAINYGSNHIVGLHLPVGQFNPGDPKPNDSSFRQGRWKKGGKHSPRVTKPIPPMNFIEKTTQWFIIKSREITQKMRGKK